MIKKLLTFTLTTLLISLGCVTSAPAQTGQKPDRQGWRKDVTDKEAQRLAKVKDAVNKIGIDENAKIRLQDGTKLKGCITEIGEDYFVLVEEKAANSNRISFAQVKQVRRVADNPFGDPAVWLGLALIPALLVGGFFLQAHDR